MVYSNHNNQYIIIISGPTGVGKSDFAHSFAQRVGGAIINADVGQVYTPLSIGTAKPSLHDTVVPHYLFNYIDTPEHFSVAAYRRAVVDIVHTLWARGIVPIIVGGSLFYINSLFFPPSVELSSDASLHTRDDTTGDLWQQLYEIDPDRAHEIHPSDRYRVQRALTIWRATGKKPSLYKPAFSPIADACVIFLHRDRQDLYDRINRRVISMFNYGWEEEVAQLDHTWYAFLQHKRLIGYPDIISYLTSHDIHKDDLIADIQKNTRKYAKRQITYWRSLQKRIAAHDRDVDAFSSKILTCNLSQETDMQCLQSCWHALQEWREGNGTKQRP